MYFNQSILYTCYLILLLTEGGYFFVYLFDEPVCTPVPSFLINILNGSGGWVALYDRKDVNITQAFQLWEDGLTECGMGGIPGSPMKDDFVNAQCGYEYRFHAVAFLIVTAIYLFLAPIILACDKKQMKRVKKLHDAFWEELTRIEAHLAAHPELTEDDTDMEELHTLEGKLEQRVRRFLWIKGTLTTLFALILGSLTVFLEPGIQARGGGGQFAGFICGNDPEIGWSLVPPVDDMRLCVPTFSCIFTWALPMAMFRAVINAIRGGYVWMLLAYVVALFLYKRKKKWRIKPEVRETKLQKALRKPLQGITNQVSTLESKLNGIYGGSAASQMMSGLSGISSPSSSAAPTAGGPAVVSATGAPMALILQALTGQQSSAMGSSDTGASGISPASIDANLQLFIDSPVGQAAVAALVTAGTEAMEKRRGSSKAKTGEGEERVGEDVVKTNRSKMDKAKHAYDSALVYGTALERINDRVSAESVRRRHVEATSEHAATTSETMPLRPAMTKKALSSSAAYHHHQQQQQQHLPHPQQQRHVPQERGRAGIGGGMGIELTHMSSPIYHTPPSRDNGPSSNGIIHHHRPPQRETGPGSSASQGSTPWGEHDDDGDGESDIPPLSANDIHIARAGPSVTASPHRHVAAVESVEDEDSYYDSESTEQAPIPAVLGIRRQDTSSSAHG